MARQTGRLDEIVTFYRDGLGLAQIDHFAGHAGYDGVMLELPGTSAHLEFTATAHGSPPMPHVEDLLVLYMVISEPLTRSLRSPSRRYPARTPTGTKSASPSVTPTVSGSFWWANMAVIQLYRLPHRLTSGLVLPLGCRGARATEVPDCQVPTPNAIPCGAVLAKTTSPEMLHWSSDCAPATPRHSLRSYGRGHR